MSTENRRVRLSVLMPAYNPGQYGRLAVASALDQMGEFDELVIQDAESTDGWLETLPADRRIQLCSEKDDGQADALNRALRRARGEWIGWLNADDVYLDNALQIINETEAADVVYGDSALIDAQGHVTQRVPAMTVSLRNLALKGCRVFNGSMFIRRELLERAGGFSSAYHFCMDYELFLRLWSLMPASAKTTKMVGALRIHEGTKTTSTPWKFVVEARQARRAVLSNRSILFFSELETLRHAITVLLTPVRRTQIYGLVRRRPRVGG